MAKAAYIIEEATKKERKRNPLPPFTTSSLQQEAVKRLNFTTKKTMMVAQQLYEGVAVGKEGSVGLITYMRTDSVRIADVAAADIRSYIESEFGKEFGLHMQTAIQVKKMLRTHMRRSAPQVYIVHRWKWQNI